MNTEHYLRQIAMAKVALANKIEADFVATNGGLATFLLASARNKAAEALLALADVNPNSRDEIVRLQNEVNRFRDMVGWLSTAAEDGNDAWHELDEGERVSLMNLIDPQESED